MQRDCMSNLLNKLIKEKQERSVQKRRAFLWSIAFIAVGVLIGIVIMPTFYYSADQMIKNCNQINGVGNWNVTKIDNKWTCTPIKYIEYANTSILWDNGGT